MQDCVDRDSPERWLAFIVCWMGSRTLQKCSTFCHQGNVGRYKQFVVCFLSLIYFKCCDCMIDDSLFRLQFYTYESLKHIMAPSIQWNAQANIFTTVCCLLSKTQSFVLPIVLIFLHSCS